MSRYLEVDEEYAHSRSRSRHRDSPPMERDHSPDYFSGGARSDRGRVPALYVPPSAHPPSRGHSSSLRVEPPDHRPRSIPPVETAIVKRQRPRSRSPASSSDEERHAPRSPMDKVRHTAKEHFTNTPSGLGVSLLGAVVGGLAAREASDAALRRHNSKVDGDDPSYRPHDSKEHQKSKMISTLVGAVVGGLGANAVGKKFESARDRDREKQEVWERRWGPESDLPHYDTGNPRDRDHRRERSPRRGRRPASDYDRDDDYNSDYTYEDSKRRPGRDRSRDPHYRV